MIELLWKIPSQQFRKKTEERVNIEKSEQIESFECYNERCDYGIFRLKSIYHDKKYDIKFFHIL